LYEVQTIEDDEDAQSSAFVPSDVTFEDASKVPYFFFVAVESED